MNEQSNEFVSMYLHLYSGEMRLFLDAVTLLVIIFIIVYIVMRLIMKKRQIIYFCNGRTGKRIYEMPRRIAHLQTRLDLSDMHIADMENLRYFVNASIIYMAGNKFFQLPAFSSPKKIQILDISNNKNYTDMSSLKKLINLEELLMINLPTASIKVLKNFKKLRVLKIQTNFKLNLNQIKHLHVLEHLTIGDEEIENIKVLKTFPKLRKLELNYMALTRYEDDLKELSSERSELEVSTIPK